MKVRALIGSALLAVVLLTSAVFAGQMTLLGVGGSSGGGFQGPGDIVSGAVAFYSCRAYSAAKVGTKAYRIQRASDSTQTDVNSLASGLCDATTPATFCAATTCTVVKYYDQSGANACTSAPCDASTAGSAQVPFSLSVLNGWPCASPSLQTHVMQFPSGGFTSAFAQPVTYTSLTERIINFTSVQRVWSQAVGGGFPRAGYNSAANQWAINATTSVPVTASDSAFHAISSIFNGAASIAVVDSTANTGLSPGTTGIASASQFLLMNDQTGGSGSNLTGFFCEGGIWPSGFNATQYGNMNTNVHSATNGWNF